MKVFISWSGDTSKQIAEALRDWLPMMLQGVDLFMSRKDTNPGSRWQNVIAESLEDSDYGLLVMTPQNLGSKWLHFEAGALGKAIADSHVVPLLHKLRPAEVEMPLAQFQMKQLDKGGLYELVAAINIERGQTLDEVSLRTLFDSLWPLLETKLGAVAEPTQPTPEPRDERGMLEEVLELVRRLPPSQLQVPNDGRGYTNPLTTPWDWTKVTYDGPDRLEGIQFLKEVEELTRAHGRNQTQREETELYMGFPGRMPPVAFIRALDDLAQSRGIKYRLLMHNWGDLS